MKGCIRTAADRATFHSLCSKQAHLSYIRTPESPHAAYRTLLDVGRHPFCAARMTTRPTPSLLLPLNAAALLDVSSRRVSRLWTDTLITTACMSHLRCLALRLWHDATILGGWDHLLDKAHAVLPRLTQDVEVAAMA
ncbi:hypothetical protein C8J57DRAFT_1492478 [Mycena rebaudengoi]|nr:hypothetical protein C8J57DRAFT_1492478 [Mycena rebaudengoi]